MSRRDGDIAMAEGVGFVPKMANFQNKITPVPQEFN